MVRRCIRCDCGPIEACMGFQLARDVSAAIDGKIPWAAVREHCGRCVLWLSLAPNDVTKRYFRSIPSYLAAVR